MKAKKKLFQRIVALCMSFCTFGIVACGEEGGGDDNGQPTHVCSFVNEETDAKYLASAADCTQAARYYYSCDCGEKGDATFAHGEANGHSGGTATTTERAICEVCGAHYGNLLNDSHVHSYTEKIVDDAYLVSAATCSTGATYAYSCKCGDTGAATFVAGEVDVTAHKGGTATFTEKATCELCGEQYGDVAHNFKEKVKTDAYLASAADCTQPAKYYYACSATGCTAKSEYTYSDGAPLGHTGGTATATEKATCTRCGEKYGDLLNAEHRHSFTEMVITDAYLASEADCTQAARYYYSCSCGEKGGQTFINGVALGHTGGTATATEKATCTRCGQQYGDLIDDSHQHNFINENVAEKYLATEATCIAPATYYYSCVCGEKGTDTFENGAATGIHTGGVATTEKGPICSVCGEEYGEHVHNFNKMTYNADHLASEADCTQPAKYYYACSCGAKGERTYVDGDPLGHTGGTATATEYATCTRCGQQYGELNWHVHNFNQKVIEAKYKASDATCVAPTTYYYSCACGEKDLTRTFAPSNDATGIHTGGTATADKAAVCTVCGQEYGQPAHVHNYTEQPFDEKYKASDADCTQPAKYYYACTCGEKGTNVYPVGEPLGHTGGTATETEYATCSVCGQQYGNLAVHIHSYTEEVAEEKYLASEATCVAPAKYYKSCACGDGSYGTDTFESGNPTGIHTGGTATETELATCTVCGQKYGELLHKHNYNNQEIKDEYKASDADCEQAARYYYVCSCGEKDTTNTFAYGDPLGHSGGEMDEVTGFATCDVCGKLYVPEIEDGEHVCKYDKKAVSDAFKKADATCQTPATYYYSCKCGNSSAGTEFENTFTFGSLGAHTGGNATCETKATCTVCGEQYGDYAAHDFTKQDDAYIASNATCGANAKYYYSCSVCGEKGTTTYEKDGTATGAHTGGNATCTTQARCTVCRQYYGAYAAHDFTKQDTKIDYKASDANCKSPATYFYSCSVCGEASTDKTFEVGSLGAHKGNTTPNEPQATCEVCGEKYGDVGHVHSYVRELAEEKYLATEATCGAPATYYKSCVCGESSKDTEFEATFAYGVGTGLHTPSGELSANNKPICGVCGQEYGEAAHVHAFTATVRADKYLKEAANCINPATYYKSCACGESSQGTEFEATFTVGTATGVHTTVGGTAATCTSKAICGACGQQFGELAAHDFTKQDNAYIASNATCGANAKYYYSCSVCDAKGTKTYEIAGTATGNHTGGTATCTTKKTCTVCGQQYGELAAHNFTKETVADKYLKTPATCGAPATYYKSCSVCGEKGTATFTSGSATGNHTPSGELSANNKNICSVCGQEYGEVVSSGGDNEGDPNAAYTLKIKVYNAGFGTGWIDAAIANFKTKYPNATITVEESADMFATLKGEIDAGTCDADIVLISDDDYRGYAASGKLVNLDDMLAGKVPGTSKSVKSMIPDAQIEYRTVNGSMYSVPWQDNFTNGIIYNKKFFTQYSLSVPETMDEYFALCEQILNLSINTDSSATNDVAPLIYAGANNGYALNFPNQWITEYYGYDYMANTFMKFTHWENNQDTEAGRQKAYDTFAKMFKGTNAAGKSYVHSSSSTASTTAAQTTFLAMNAKAAMYVCGPWLYTEEATKLLTGGLSSRVEFGFFGLPHINADKKDAFGNDSSNVRYSLGANALAVLSSSANQEAAKLFLAEMYTDTNLKAFIQNNSGLGRPLTEWVDISGLTVGNTGTAVGEANRLAFTHEAYEYYYGTAAKPTKSIYQRTISDMSYHISPALYGGENDSGGKDMVISDVITAVNYEAAMATIAGAASRETQWVKAMWDFETNTWKASYNGG